MRVIGGSARGRALKGPPRPKQATSGRQRQDTRPTSDLIRGVIFDILDAMEAEYDRVLDLYAGTGALGIEALSRGEGTADFVEQNRDVAAIVRANLDVTGFAARAKVHIASLPHAIPRLEGPYTLVLADPPYYDADALAAVDAIASAALIAPGGVLVLEHHRKTAAPERLGPLPLYKSRRHGDTVVSIYRQEDAS